MSMCSLRVLSKNVDGAVSVYREYISIHVDASYANSASHFARADTPAAPAGIFCAMGL